MTALRGFQLPRRQPLIPGPSLFRSGPDYREEGCRGGDKFLPVSLYTRMPPSRTVRTTADADPASSRAAPLGRCWDRGGT